MKIATELRIPTKPDSATHRQAQRVTRHCPCQVCHAPAPLGAGLDALVIQALGHGVHGTNDAELESKECDPSQQGGGAEGRETGHVLGRKTIGRYT